MKPLRDQFLMPERERALYEGSRHGQSLASAMRNGRTVREQVIRDDLARQLRRKRRIAHSIAVGIARAVVKRHGIESDVPLYPERKRRTVVTVTVETDDLFL